MFSPGFLGYTGTKWLFGFDQKDAFRDEARFVDNVKDSNESSVLMSPPPKRGRYCMTEDDTEKPGQSHVNDEKYMDMKQCEYVSNRTRLRCRNMKRVDQMKDYGFCSEHVGYVERIRKEGLRTKHMFDPNFTKSESFKELISYDADETLEPHHSEDFPFVYESLYCDSRIDNDDNPLRRAWIYTKKEVIREYISALDRWQMALHEQRTIYNEKQLRVLKQIVKLNEQSDNTLLDPDKEADKVERFLAMRRSALRLDMKWVLIEKYKHMGRDQLEVANANTEQSSKLLEQLKEIVQRDVLVCARINKPWDGTRKADLQQQQPQLNPPTIIQQQQQLSEQEEQQQLSKKPSQTFQKRQIQNNHRKPYQTQVLTHQTTTQVFKQLARQVSPLEPPETRPGSSNSTSSNSLGSSVSSYQQYLSRQHLISLNTVRPSILRPGQQTPMPHLQPQVFTQQQQQQQAYRYGNGVSPQQQPSRGVASRGRGRGRVFRPISSIVNVEKFPNS